MEITYWDKWVNNRSSKQSIVVMVNYTQMLGTHISSLAIKNGGGFAQIIFKSRTAASRG